MIPALMPGGRGWVVVQDEVSRLRTNPNKSPGLQRRLSLAGVHSSPGTQLHIRKVRANLVVHVRHVCVMKPDG